MLLLIVACLDHLRLVRLAIVVVYDCEAIFVNCSSFLLWLIALSLKEFVILRIMVAERVVVLLLGNVVLLIHLVIAVVLLSGGVIITVVLLLHILIPLLLRISTSAILVFAIINDLPNLIPPSRPVLIRLLVRQTRVYHRVRASHRLRVPILLLASAGTWLVGRLSCVRVHAKSVVWHGACRIQAHHGFRGCTTRAKASTISPLQGLIPGHRYALLNRADIAIGLIEVDRFVLLCLTLHDVVIVPILIHLATIAIVLLLLQQKLMLLAISVPFFAANHGVIDAQLLLDLRQAGLPVQHEWFNVQASGLPVTALLNQLLQLLDIRVFHFSKDGVYCVLCCTRKYQYISMATS